MAARVCYIAKLLSNFDSMENIEKFLRAISDDKRLRILKMLEKRHMCVCEITVVLGIRQPTVSRHLKRLEDVGLIRQEQNGFYTECYIAEEHSFHDVWKSVSGKLEESTDIKSDLRKMDRVDRSNICGNKVK